MVGAVKRLVAGTLLAPFLLVQAASTADKGPKPILYPSDLGPETIDVSLYPNQYKETYEKEVKVKCVVCHSAARVFNSPHLELSKPEEALERRRHPELFADPQIVQAGPEVWKMYLKKMMMRPACCGVCPVLTHDDLKKIWEFLRYDARQRKTGRNAPKWIAHRKELIRKFAALHPEKP